MTRQRAILIAGLLLVLYFAIIILLGNMPGDGDQAAYINGSLRLASSDVPFLNPQLFDYDKQFDAYWLLAFTLRMSRGISPVLVSNALQVLVFGIALCAVGCRLVRSRTTPLLLLLPLYLCPAMVFAIPFFDTSVLSLCFLLIAFSFTQYWRRPVEKLAVCLSGARGKLPRRCGARCSGAGSQHYAA